VEGKIIELIEKDCAAKSKLDKVKLFVVKELKPNKKVNKEIIEETNITKVLKAIHNQIFIIL
jgi:hypothetical protein